MNKLTTCILFCILNMVCLAANPVLEISEFGKKTPVTVNLNGSVQNVNGDNWSCVVRKVSGDIPYWNLSFTSPSHDQPVRLQLKFSVPVNFTAQRLWDGDLGHNISQLPFERTNYLDAFPLITVENGQSGQALGFAPQNILSGFSRMFDGKMLSVTTRIVVDNRRTQVIDIVDYTFTPEFGWCNAVEDYQNGFIEWFTLKDNIDPRIHGVSGYHLGGHLQRPFQLHSQRYHQISWEWTYAPWYESGNWFAAGENWSGEKNIYWDYFGHKKTKLLTRAEYHDAVKQEMHYGNKVSAMFYYILVKDIHNNVALNYPDAVQGSSGLHSRPSNAGKTKSVFAPGSRIFDYLKNQLRQVVENYEISGFSFDMANSSYHFTTPSQLNYAVGRSWYDDGTIFTSDTVAPIPFADYVHTLSRDGKRMGAIFNMADQMISPFTFFHCDGAIIEGPPSANARLVMPLRLIMGRKPASFWHLRALPVEMWRIAHKPQKVAEFRHAFNQLYLLKCYELGFAAMNWVSALEELKPHLSALRAISKAGYHPVSAIKGANQLWVGRFGDDTGTILTISNPTKETLTRTIRVVNRYLGDGKYAFVAVNGKLAQKFENGDTVFEITLEPKEILVLRTVKIDGNISEITTETTQQTIVLNGNGRFAFLLPAKDFDGRLISGATKDVFSGNAENRISLAILPASRIFGDVAAMVDLMSPENSPAVEAGNGADTQIAAEMVAMYRPHIDASIKFKGVRNNGAPGFMDSSLARPDLMITAPKQGNASKKICLGTPEEFPDFTPPANWNRAFLSMPDANTLWIGGSTPEEIRQAALVYFDLLDNYQATKIKVNFARPVGWGGRATFIQGDGQKYLRLIGDPEQKNNSFYYAYYYMPAVKGEDEIAFTISCQLKKLTAGKYRVGIYEFSDDKCLKSLRFQAVDVPVAANWQTITKRIKLHKNTKKIRFYVLGQNAGKGDTLLVRSLEFIKNTNK